MKKIRFTTMILLASALVLAAMTLTGCGAKTLNLNKYLTYEIKGPNGYGYVENYFDTSAFEEDLSKALGSSENKNVLEDLGDLGAALVIEEAAGNGAWDKSEKLSNGDKITYDWKIDADSIEKKYGVRLKWSKITETVSNLEEVAAFDPFEGIKIEAAYGDVSVSSDKYPNLSFSTDKSSGVSVGETVTITLETSPESCIDEYSAVPSKTEMKYKVEKMDGYMTNVSQITEDLDKQIKGQVDDYVESFFADDDDDFLKGHEFVGYYLLTNKDQSSYSYGDHNQLYAVFTWTFDHKEEKVNETMTSYMYLKFTDAKVYADGTAYVDLLNYTHPDGGWFSDEVFKAKSGITYIGYKDLDTFYNQQIVSQKEKYSVTSDVES